MKGNQKTTTARCGMNHGGNHTLHPTAKGAWECAGCGKAYTAEEVAKPTLGPLGSGGVIRPAQE